MNMSSKPKGNEITATQAISTQVATGGVSVEKSARDEDIRRRAYEIYSSAANNRAVSWTIGSKPSANSNAACV